MQNVIKEPVKVEAGSSVWEAGGRTAAAILKAAGIEDENVKLILQDAIKDQNPEDLVQPGDEFEVNWDEVARSLQRTAKRIRQVKEAGGSVPVDANPDLLEELSLYVGRRIIK